MLVDKRDDLAPRTVEPGRVILNYHVTDIQSHRRHLDALGVEWVSEVEYRDDGGAWFGTVVDPDGNYVQLIELTPEYWSKRRARHGPAAGASGPLSDARSAVRLPAQDLERARRWYAEKLGLEPAETRDGGLSYECGGTLVRRRPPRRVPRRVRTPRWASPSATSRRPRPSCGPAGVELLEAGIVDVAGHYPSTGATGERAIWLHDSEGNVLGVGQLVYD